ncbi:hypothetical protein JYG23_02835 [Sedimentibacter sp. zth1]|uniref:hypothetical protein n=1 Tax=Sedimentibacter sp. zth1 TaxID=2816908 RepID=UPI001A937016|nr:hypothetical protein [Sedimentibacter sp. zth1]QSX06413.1 hypothetical protein JYG23_02835 [Sedimentibacter sp. zth1]
MKAKNIISSKNFISVIIIVVSLLILLNILNELTKPLTHIYPDYNKIDISPIIDKSVLIEKDYETLFYQTGLGKASIDKLLEDKKYGKIKILNIQEHFFAKVIVNRNAITPFTYEETTIDKQNRREFATNLAPLENGYILLTRSTYSFGWRHGHAAIVVDSENKKILEAAVLGAISQISSTNKWRLYPNFIILKLKNVEQTKLDNISNYALTKLIKIPYRISSGIFTPKYKDNTEPSGTQCSHLVWFPFKVNGYDIDSNGGMIVTPKDIANSDLLEIVQIYGFNPKELWK